MYKYLRDDVKKLKAYEVMEMPYRVKLDANEGVDWLDGLNRYPLDRSDQLREKLAKKLGKTPKELLFGNGSSELIELVMKAYLEAGETVVSISPTFSMYKIFTTIHKGLYEEFPLENMENLDLQGFLGFIKEKKPKIVLISNPNNPTGSIIDREDILEIVKSSDAMVVLDEAYIEFSDYAFADDTREFENLVVLRTFSKALSLAGIRLGYMIGCEDTIDYINRVRSPYNVNVISQSLGIKALENESVTSANIEVIKSERGRMKLELEKMGFAPLDSQANFLFFPGKKGLGEALGKRGVLIRGFGGALEGYYRLTIGTPDENQEVLEAIKEVQNERS